MRFREKKKAKENFWNVNVDNVVISKLIEKKNSKYLTGIKFDKTISFDNA